MSPEECWAVGENGTIVHTIDGGSNWIVQKSETTENLFGLAFSDALHGVAVGYHAMLVTSDGGASWHQDDPGERTFLAATKGGTYYWVVGPAGLIATKKLD